MTFKKTFTTPKVPEIYRVLQNHTDSRGQMFPGMDLYVDRVYCQRAFLNNCVEPRSREIHT